MIAVKNARLLTEIQARNRDLTESLDRQTATADILRAISQAQTDIQPVFEAIAYSAMRLFEAWSAAVFRYDGALMSAGCGAGRNAREHRPRSWRAIARPGVPR